MAIKKLELYLSLRQGCDELRGGISADIAALQAKLTKARALKQGMIQNLLTERVRLV